MSRKHGAILTLVIASCVGIFCWYSFSSNIRVPCEEGPENIGCWSGFVAKKISKSGLQAGFRALGKIYEEYPGLRPDCHQVAMRVGALVYQQVPDYRNLVYTAESAKCNYGFYQEYPHSLLLATKNIDEAKEFCAYVKEKIGRAVPGIEAECYRGVGRGLPFIEKNIQGDESAMVAFAVATCKTIAPNHDSYATCVSGSFSALGRAEISGTSGKSVRVDDPMWLCHEQHDSQAAESCWGNFKWAVVSLTDESNIEQASNFFLHTFASTSRAQFTTIWTLGYEMGRRSTADESRDYDDIIATCEKVHPPHDIDCIQGVSVGLAKHATPGEQHRVIIVFCREALAKIPSLKNTDCPTSQAVGYIRGFYTPLHFEQACIELRSALGRSCEKEKTLPYGQ